MTAGQWVSEMLEVPITSNVSYTAPEQQITWAVKRVVENTSGSSGHGADSQCSIC